MEVHELLKKLRVDRGLTQEELSYNITSRKSLTNYENGKTAIPFLVLLDFLERLNLSVDEFTFYLDKDKPRKKNGNLKRLINDIREDKGSTSYTLKKISEEVRQTKDIALIRDYLIVKTYNWFQLSANERKLSKKDKEYLDFFADYLERIDEWGRFEMTSFSSLLFLFETSYIKQRLSEIEKKIEKNQNFEIFHSILSGLYNNSFLLMLERKELKLSKHYLQKLSQIHHKTLFAREREIYYKFYSMLVDYLQGDNKKAEEIQRFFNGLEIIEADKLLKEFKMDLAKFEEIYGLPNEIK